MTELARGRVATLSAMSRAPFFLWVCVVHIAGCSGPARVADSAEPSPPRRGEVVAPRAAEETGGEEERNAVALFLGATSKDASTSGAVGAKYERRLSDLLGLGIVIEVTPALEERLVTFPAVILHPIGELTVILAPGVVTEDGDSRLAFRTGLGWELEIGGGITLSPEVNFDWADDHDDALVVGVAVGTSF